MLLKTHTLLLLIFTSCSIFAQNRKILVSASEPNAIILSNGQHMGTGTANVVVPKNGSIVVEVNAVGFLKSKQVFYNQKGMPKPPSTMHFQLVEDDSFVASVANDKANVDFTVEINSELSDVEAWKLAVSIVTDYFDVLEIADRETNYLRTSWQTQTFANNTIRTRVILKAGSSGRSFKIKLVSEFSGKAGTSVKDDEAFKEWDRVLRRYASLIQDFQARLKK